MDELAKAEPRIIDGYKRDTRKRLLAALVPGSLAAMLGAMLLLGGLRSLYARDPASRYASRPMFQGFEGFAEIQAKIPPAPPWERVFIYAGTLLCLASPIIMGFSLRRLLDDSDDFLLLRNDGLVHQTGGKALLFPWDELDAVKYDETGDALVLVLADESEVRITERYTGAATRELARHIADFRRKALWQLLPSQRRKASR